jgi:hypothetical protein
VGVWFGCGDTSVHLPTFVLVSRIHLVEQYRRNDHFLMTTSSSRRETMVGGVLVRDSTIRVDLGVGGVIIASGSCAEIPW